MCRPVFLTIIMYILRNMKIAVCVYGQPRSYKMVDIAIIKQTD